MKITIRTKGQVKMTDTVREHIEKQVMVLDKLFYESEHVNANVLCIEKDEKFKTEITIVLKHIILRSECKGDTLYASINLAADKIEQQLIKYKKKINAIIKKREGIAQYFIDKEENSTPQSNDIIKTKKVDIMEMSVDEAITHMEMSDHSFYMFRNEETHCIATVYKREKGGYGLIESLE